MMKALREARSVTCNGKFSMQLGALPPFGCRFEMRLEKPNAFRVDVKNAKDGTAATLIGDGETAWTFWPDGRPVLSMEDYQTKPADRMSHYMKEPAPLARHSISHLTAMLGYGMSMLILDPSAFHGYTDGLQPLIDGVTPLEDADVDGVSCHGVRVSIMDGQRVWEIWLSKEDRLPRRMTETIHVQQDIVKEETWSDVVLNADVPDELFAWTPPEGWTEYHVPTPESQMIKVGEPAPDFDLELADGGRFKLSEQRGKVVWLVFWRSG
jgi:hypothetical protein